MSIYSSEKTIQAWFRYSKDHDTFKLKSYICLFKNRLLIQKPKKAAHKLYTNLGYTVYRTILNYYGGGTGAVGEENAYDMRKSMSKDVKKETTVPLTRPVTADEIEWH